MMRQYTVITGPTEEPVTLEEAKLHLRVDGTAEDSLIEHLITMAREACEAKARRAFCSRTLELRLDQWPLNGRIEFSLPPLQSVTSVTYTDENGETGTMPATDYVVYSDLEPGLLVLKVRSNWPSVNLMPGPSIAVRYVAGYASPAAVPAIYKQAILLTVGTWYANRESVVVGTVGRELPQAVESLLAMDRVSWW